MVLLILIQLAATIFLPLIIRFLVIQRPLKKRTSVTVAIVNGVAFAFLFTFLSLYSTGRALPYPGVALGAYFSFFILRKMDKEPEGLNS